MIKENQILLKGKFLNYRYDVKNGNVLRNSKRIMTCELLEIEELSIIQINDDCANPENGIKLFDISLSFSYNKQNTQTVICRVAQRVAATDKESLTTDKHR